MKITFETVRKHSRKQLDKGADGKETVFYGFGDVFDNETYAHEIVRMNYTGWFTEEDGTTYWDGWGLVRGIVAELPAMPGFNNGRFLAGYHWGDNDEKVYFPALFDNAEDAAYAADSHAESFAELQREDNAKFKRADAIQSDIAIGVIRLRECLALRNRGCMSYVRDEAHELISQIKEWRETLRTEYADFC